MNELSEADRAKALEAFANEFGFSIAKGLEVYAQREKCPITARPLINWLRAWQLATQAATKAATSAAYERAAQVCEARISNDYERGQDRDFEIACNNEADACAIDIRALAKGDNRE